VLTIFGAAAVTFMMVMYALERRDRRYVLGFALGERLIGSPALRGRRAFAARTRDGDRRQGGAETL
jgi:hypothetical protein